MIPRWMRIAYVVFGLTSAAIGIWSLAVGNYAIGALQLAVGVGWLLVAALKGRRLAASHPNFGRGTTPPP